MSTETAVPVEASESASPAENEAEATGGFREPHSDVPEGFSSHEDAPPAEIHEPEPVAPAAALPPLREPRREPRRDDRRDERSPQPTPRVPVSQRQWVKPADFRPAEASAISEAVAHATEIAESLKQMIDQLDEVLELVEVAERQKLADERELDELRRALRRIQPPRREQPQQQPARGPRRDEPRRDYREQNQRRDEPRQNQPPREQPEKSEAPPAPPAAEPPPAD